MARADDEHDAGAGAEDGGTAIDPNGLLIADEPPDAPRRRGRGRPRNDGANSSGDGEHLGTAGGDAKPKRRRRRAKSEKVAINAEFLASQIQGLHVGVAIVLQDMKWSLSNEESQMLATSLEHCCMAFNVSVDPRVLAVSELLGVAMMIYMPRVLMSEPDRHAYEEPTTRQMGGDGIIQ